MISLFFEYSSSREVQYLNYSIIIITSKFILLLVIRRTPGREDILLEYR